MLDYFFLCVVEAYKVSLFDYWKSTWSEFKPLQDRLDFIFFILFTLVRKELVKLIIRIIIFCYKKLCYTYNPLLSPFGLKTLSVLDRSIRLIDFLFTSSNVESLSTQFPAPFLYCDRYIKEHSNVK